MWKLSCYILNNKKMMTLWEFTEASINSYVDVLKNTPTVLAFKKNDMDDCQLCEECALIFTVIRVHLSVSV